MFPYCLRAIQLVVAYNTHYRLKYARYVKTKNILKMSVMIGTAILVAALFVMHKMPERYARCDCLGGVEPWLVLQALPTYLSAHIHLLTQSYIEYAGPCMRAAEGSNLNLVFEIARAEVHLSARCFLHEPHLTLRCQIWRGRSRQCSRRVPGASCTLDTFCEIAHPILIFYECIQFQMIHAEQSSGRVSSVSGV